VFRIVCGTLFSVPQFMARLRAFPTSFSPRHLSGSRVIVFLWCVCMKDEPANRPEAGDSSPLAMIPPYSSGFTPVNRSLTNR